MHHSCLQSCHLVFALLSLGRAVFLPTYWQVSLLQAGLGGIGARLGFASESLVRTSSSSWFGRHQHHTPYCRQIAGLYIKLKPVGEITAAHAVLPPNFLPLLLWRGGQEPDVEMNVKRREQPWADFY